MVTNDDTEALGPAPSKWLIRMETLLARSMYCHYMASKYKNRGFTVQRICLTRTRIAYHITGIFPVQEREQSIF
jgi:hypothetical protein